MQVRETDLATVRNILGRTLPGVPVFAFGSRVKLAPATVTWISASGAPNGRTWEHLAICAMPLPTVPCRIEWMSWIGGIWHQSLGKPLNETL